MYKLSVLFAFSLFLFESHQTKVKLTVLYESLCSDSQNLISNYFTEKVPELLPYVDIEYIPYGKANYRRSSNSYIFTCQHGDKECFGNKIQACATFKSPNLLRTSKFVDCAMKAMYSYNYEDQLEECADRAGINWADIINCANGQLGSTLLATNGDITDRSVRKLHFVPMILVDNKIIVESTADFANFFSKMCTILNNKPSGCLSSNQYYHYF